MTETLSDTPARLPDRTSVAEVLSGLAVGLDYGRLAAALSGAFPGFAFSAVGTTDRYFLQRRSVLAQDGSRVAEDLQLWLRGVLDQHNGDVGAAWKSLKDSELHLAEWHGNGVFAFAPTGIGAADFIQIAFSREAEFQAGPIVNPVYRPWSVDDLLDPRWLEEDELIDDRIIAGPRFRMRGKPGTDIVHLRSFLGRCARKEREKREARRPEMERRSWVGPDGTRIPFLQHRRDWFEQAPFELRFFQDWEGSSAGSRRVYEHFGFEIHDYEDRGERRLGFIVRPHRLPEESLPKEEEASVHILMDRIEAIDRELGLPFGWFFLMVHGNRIPAEVGHLIATGLREGRVRLPDRDARVLLRWAEDPYGF